LFEPPATDLDVGLRLPFIALALLLPALFRDADRGGLDEWLAQFGGAVAVRHDPLADACATAQLLPIAPSAADARGRGNAKRLLAIRKARRWLGRRA
jgi:hypothetical protein